MDKLKTGEMIRQARMEKGYTQNELGMLLGVTNKAISRWENGDSFPDVGVLEQLSHTLGLTIQDIVTGEADANCGEAVTEIARVAKIQEKEKRNRIVVLSMGGILWTILLLIGLRTFHGGPVFSTIYYFCFMAVLLSMVSLKCLSDDYLANLFQRKISKWTTILSIVTGIYAVVSVLLTVGLVRQDIILFQMDRSSLGPFMNSQLMMVFFINLSCFAIECIRVGLARQDVHAGIYMIVCNLFLTMIYSDLLHRLTSIQEFFSIFVLDTVVLVAEVIVFFVLTLLVTRVLHKKGH